MADYYQLTRAASMPPLVSTRRRPRREMTPGPWIAVIAASNSDISGPPTLRAGIPGANPSAYIGASTSVGTPSATPTGLLVSL